MSFYDLPHEFMEGLYSGQIKKIAFYDDLGDVMGKVDNDWLVLDLHFFSPRGLTFFMAGMLDSPHIEEIYVDDAVKRNKPLGEKFAAICSKIVDRNSCGRIARNINKEADLINRPISFSSFYQQNREKGRGFFKSVFLAFCYRYLASINVRKEFLYEYIMRTDELNLQASKMNDDFWKEAKKVNGDDILVMEYKPTFREPPLRFHKAAPPRPQNKDEAEAVVGANKRAARRAAC